MRGADDGMERSIEAWDGLGVVASRHRETGSWIFVALHDATLGRPTGGCRLGTYPTPAAGLRDAMRLAEGMSYKWAAMNLPYGGGKSVLAVPGPVEGEARRGLFRRLARVIDALNGGYAVGADLGTTPADMAFLSSWTSHVAKPRDGNGGEVVDPGPFTAAGVHAGIVAALRRARGRSELDGVTVLVEGVGAVGGRLAESLSAAGAAVLTTDLDAERARAVARECGGRAVDLAAAVDVECDVYAPCAVGATLNERTIPRLRCRVVAGAANNQLETPEDATRLAERDILYAPDYVINGGGAMAFGLMEQGVANVAEAMERVRSIGETLDEIFAEARSTGVSPAEAANRRARRALGRAAP